jgi:uncharacterized membrane-anchored protein YhcB (DUF1043 family)
MLAWVAFLVGAVVTVVLGAWLARLLCAGDGTVED